ncbi:hypothetical protein LJC13_02095 [Peptostreptococcaceae bacterium OttesenSCG-928-C18]|nr:hypothetical protein [Peptostreptococcaceae bacterium OttesenSCG-928-C18]
MNKVEQGIGLSKAFSNFQMFLGIVFIIFSMYKIGDSSYIRTSFMNWMLVIGVITIIFSIRKKRICKIGMKYAPILYRPGVYDISKLSSNVGVPESQVKDELQKLIGKGYLLNSHIDMKMNTLVMKDNLDSEKTKDNTVIKNVTVEVFCKSCGGVNEVLKGKSGECEYCGSKIKG